jgi:hypothetical protein
MDPWLYECKRLLAQALGHARSDNELILTVVVAVVMLTVVLRIASHAMKASMATYPRAFIATAASIAAVVAGVAALNVYGIPRLPNPAVADKLPYVVTGLIVLLVAAPVCVLLLKAPYFEAVFAMVLSVGAAFGISILAHYVSDAWRAGKHEMLPTQERKQELRDVMR